MLENEKYKGDALLQKSYTVDFLTKKRVQNNGEIQMYYVEDDHEAIIPKKIWECVQLEFARKKKYRAEKFMEYTDGAEPLAEIERKNEEE